MRVITGVARGRNLQAPEGQHTRPTAQRVKEAIFSIIQFEIEGAAVLDLFAGSGQLGIEALSRGARSAVFVDNSRQSQEIIRDNLSHTGLASESRLVGADVFSYLQTIGELADIAFLDPPYQKGMLEKALPLVAEKLRDSGAILCEVDARTELPQEAGRFVLRREYRYGRTKVGLYRMAEKEDEQ